MQIIYIVLTLSLLTGSLVGGKTKTKQTLALSVSRSAPATQMAQSGPNTNTNMMAKKKKREREREKSNVASKVADKNYVALLVGLLVMSETNTGSGDWIR